MSPEHLEGFQSFLNCIDDNMSYTGENEKLSILSGFKIYS